MSEKLTGFFPDLIEASPLYQDFVEHECYKIVTKPGEISSAELHSWKLPFRFVRYSREISQSDRDTEEFVVENSR